MDIRDRVIEMRRVRLGDLIPNEKNWRTHPQNQRQAYKKLVESIGFAGAELAYKLDDGRLKLIDGHMRRDMHPDSVLPVIVTDLNEEEADVLLASFDPMASLAGMSNDKLSDLLKSVKDGYEELDTVVDVIASEFDIKFDDGDLPDVPPARIDEADKLNEIWQVKSGDLWIIPGQHGNGDHRLLCGDSTNENDVRRVMDGEQFAMVFTDPPYGIKYDSTATGRSKRQFSKIQNDDLEGSEFRVFCEELMEALLTCQMDNASYYLCCANRTAHHMIMAAEAVGLHYAVPLVWVKQHFALNWDRYHPQHEWIFYGGEGAKPTGAGSRWYGAKNETTVWQIDRDNTADYSHPTQKPVELPARAIRNSSDVGEIVVDVFGGSGSTMVACEQLNRRCRMIEIEPKYCAVILERMKSMGLEPYKAN